MNYTVDAVHKALSLLFLVADQPGLGVTELSKRAGMTKARSYRLLDTLEKGGLVQRRGAGAIYSLGYMALFLGASAKEQLVLVRLAKKYLGEIGARVKEHLYVRIRDGDASVCIAHWDTHQAIYVHTKIGSRRPLYAGASGKLLLAHASAGIQESVLAADKERFTSQTPFDAQALQKEITQIRAAGYSISRGEINAGVVAIAVPVCDGSGTAHAALSVALPASRANSACENAYLEVLREYASEFSRELDYVGSFSAD